MTDHNSEYDALDRLADEIRRNELDADEAEVVVNRVWDRLVAGEERPLRGCGDFQTMIPALVAGELSESRSLLVEDHTRSCVSCRKVLLEARGELTQSSERLGTRRPWSVPRSLRIAAAAILVIGAGLLGARTVGNLLADQRVTATVTSVDGSLKLVASGSNLPLASGEIVRSRQVLRTAKDSGAELRLADGSRIEIDARSEIELRAAMRGTTIRLKRGNIIVHAAQQHGGRLSVATDDCRVAVRGTIFAVAHGLKGSRVAVIEGEVEVRRSGVVDVLAPGEQVTTNDRLQTVAIEDQIAWSPNVDEHMALLRELTKLQRDVIRAVDSGERRTSTRLLELVPEDTVLYASIPNLAEGLGEARNILDERVASNSSLSEWWDRNVVAKGIDRQIDEVIDRLVPLGEALGDEIVVAVALEGFTSEQGPIVLAALEDPDGFKRMLADEVARANSLASKSVLEILEGQQLAPASEAEVFFWIHDDLVAAASQPWKLTALAKRVDNADDGVTSRSELFARLYATYQQGVSWLIGIDLESVLAHAAVDLSAEERAILDRLGALDATSIVLTHSRNDGAATAEAGVYFSGRRRGMAAWLGDPASIAGLDFLSPQASVVGAFVAQDAAVIFDELLNVLANADPNAVAELRRFEQELGLDVRADLAAPLGGEGTFALDGPILPIPSWKLILEVNDPVTLQHTIETVVARLDDELRAHDLPGVTLETAISGGREYHTLHHLAADFSAVYTMLDGYLIMAPQQALIELALQYRDSGVNLAASAAFLELLPDNGYTDCSALFYRNLAQVADALGDAVALPPDARALIEQSAEPSLICVVGEEDRILLSGTGDGLIGPAPMMGLSGLIMGGCGPHAAGQTQVSSSG